MRTLSTLSFAILAGLGLAQNPILNPSFENWVDDAPQHWTTNNNAIIGITISPEGSGYVGSNAAHGEVVPGLGSTYPPYLVSLDQSGDPHPVDQAYDRLSFHYKLELLSLVGMESFVAAVVIQDAAGNAIGGGSTVIMSDANTSTWTLGTVPILYSGEEPAGAVISFILGGNDVAEGSFFVVDNVVLDFGPSAVPELASVATLGAAYPSPAADMVSLPFTLATASTVQLQVLDAAGHHVLQRDLGTLAQGGYKEELEVGTWATGTYMAVLTTATGRHFMPFAVGGSTR